VRCHAHRFVDDYKFVIVQQDQQVVHNFLHDFQGIPAVRHDDVEHGAEGELERLPDPLGIAGDVALGDQRGCLGAGDVHQPGQAGVHAGAGEVLRDGELAVPGSCSTGFTGSISRHVVRRVGCQVVCEAVGDVRRQILRHFLRGASCGVS
jgi:hypothetical protein